MGEIEYGEIFLKNDKALDERILAKRYRWEGGPYILIDPEAVRALGADVTGKLGNDIQIGPFKLTWMATYHDRDTEGMRDLYHRNDKGWTFRSLWWRVRQWCRLFKSRFILMCVVWGCGFTPIYSIPEWSDLYAVTRIKRVFNR